MNKEIAEKLLIQMESIDKRLMNLEKFHATVDVLTVEQQKDVLTTLQQIEGKMTAVLETQRLNVEILRVFSGDLVQH